MRRRPLTSVYVLAGCLLAASLLVAACSAAKFAPAGSVPGKLVKGFSAEEEAPARNAPGGRRDDQAPKSAGWRSPVADPPQIDPLPAADSEDARSSPETNPLTGLPIADAALLDRRPLAIKVSNFPVQGRPHSGLSAADLVAEYFIGEGMTRFLAFYYGQDSPRVGPIRSGRLIDGELTRLYGGFLGMKGADAYVVGRLNEALPGRVFNAKPSACPALCPETTSHTYGTFADTAAFSRYAVGTGADNLRPELNGTFFLSEPPPGGARAERIWLFYAYLNQVGWDYDPETGAYLRSQDNADANLAPMPDRLTGEQLRFENIVVLFAPHDFISPTIIDIRLWRERNRPALALRDGRLYEISWSAPSTDHPIRFLDASGEPFPLKPGSTWLEVVGLPSTVEELEPGFWKVRFRP